MTTKTKVTLYEVIDHGVDHAQYFQGCGTAFTDYDNVVTGCGDNPREAFEDVLDQIAMSYDVDVDDLEAQILGEWGVITDTSVWDEDGKFHREFPETPSVTEVSLESNGLSEEPSREDFDDESEYHDALEEYEQEVEDINEDSEMYYYISIRWKG